MKTQKQMYGTTKVAVLNDFKQAQKLYGRHTNLYIMGILSDAQLMIEHKQYNTARQFINKAKLLISDRASEYLNERKDRHDI